MFNYPTNANKSTEQLDKSSITKKRFAQSFKTLPLMVSMGVALGMTSAAQANSGCVDYDKAGAGSAEEKSIVSDAWLDGKLESALLFNTHLNSFEIDTEVTDCVAYISGFVESDIDKDLAEEISKSIDGIKRVENKLSVREKGENKKVMPEDSREVKFKRNVLNATTTAQIKTGLLLNTNTSGLSIDVDSTDGEVVLSGTVASAQEKSLAEAIAENRAEGRKINNQLQVKK
ncbi:MAG: BON domain-containing protein [Immundisolibacteraceae bacterium]|nr:BON domain-containing protein [Immundisolibacteraceae bacterium]